MQRHTFTIVVLSEYSEEDTADDIVQCLNSQEFDLQSCDHVQTEEGDITPEGEFVPDA